MENKQKAGTFFHSAETLTENLGILLSRYENAVEESRKQEEILAQYRSKLLYAETELTKERNKNKELEEYIERIKLGEAFISSTGNRTEALDLLNRIIREMDKCIRLMKR